MADIHVPGFPPSESFNPLVDKVITVRIRSQVALAFSPQFSVQRKLVSTDSSRDHWESLGIYTWGESAEFPAWTVPSIYRIKPEDDSRDWFVINEKQETHQKKGTVVQILCEYNKNGTRYKYFIIQVDLGTNFDGINGLVPDILPQRPEPPVTCGQPDHGKPGHFCP